MSTDPSSQNDFPSLLRDTLRQADRDGRYVEPGDVVTLIEAFAAIWLEGDLYIDSRVRHDVLLCMQTPSGSTASHNVLTAAAIFRREMAEIAENSEAPIRNTYGTLASCAYTAARAFNIACQHVVSGPIRDAAIGAFMPALTRILLTYRAPKQ